MSAKKFITNYLILQNKTLENSITVMKTHILELIKMFEFDYSKYVRLHEVKLGNLGLSPSDSLLHVRLWEYLNISRFLVYGISSGHYHQTYREMRFLIDSWAQAYYIDRLYVERSLKEKINNKELGLYGRHLIQRAFSNPKYAQELSTFYNALSKYTHGSKEELAKFDKYRYAALGAKIFFDAGVFEECNRNLIGLHGMLMIMLEV
jgi:hypothetical protein